MCLDMRRIVKVGPYWYRAIDLYYWVYQCVVCEVHPSLYLLTSYHTIANMAQSINHCGILTWKKYLSNMVTNTDSNIPTYSLSIFFNTQNKNKTKKHLPCDPLKNLQKKIFKNMYFCFWTHFVYNSLLLLWQFLCFSSAVSSKWNSKPKRIYNGHLTQTLPPARWAHIYPVYQHPQIIAVSTTDCPCLQYELLLPSNR